MLMVSYLLTCVSDLNHPVTYLLSTVYCLSSSSNSLSQELASNHRQPSDLMVLSMSGALTAISMPSILMDLSSGGIRQVGVVVSTSASMYIYIPYLLSNAVVTFSSDLCI